MLKEGRRVERGPGDARKNARAAQPSIARTQMVGNRQKWENHPDSLSTM
jgi:hypothetical protein